MVQRRLPTETHAIGVWDWILEQLKDTEGAAAEIRVKSDVTNVSFIVFTNTACSPSPFQVFA